MSIVYGLLLIILGLIAAQDAINTKAPAFRKIPEALSAWSEPIGFVALLLGILWLLHAISMLTVVGRAFFIVLEIWVVALLTLALGLIFGLNLTKHIIGGEPTPAFVVKLEEWRAKLLPYRNELGIAGIVVGVIYLF